MTKEYYSIAEVAKLINVSEWTVRKYCRKGTIKAIKFGGPKGEWYIYIKNFRGNSGK